MSEVNWDHLDITHDELNRFTNAFKSDEFRKLFADYCNEITDPENRRVYEAELKQLEAERGVSVTFINPDSGFVIKTTVDGKQKVFINVAKCDQIEAPSSERGQDASTGQYGLNWRIPYVQSKPRRDFDNNKTVCPVYDVVFHPDTLHLAKKNAMFKRLVIDTACDAVQTTHNVKLDLVNLKFPKMGYKGTPRPTIIRKKTGEPINVDASPIDSIYPPIPPTEADAPTKVTNVKPKQRIANEYATPKYEIVHRRAVEMHEMTDALDAKINLTVPKELVVRINLPLLSSSKDVTLDVNTKSIYLCSEKPAKYKVTIPLPFEVVQLEGKARFDNAKRQLEITLPVVREKRLVIADLCREDSGVESDHHSPKEDSSSGDDVFEDALETLSTRAHRQDDKVNGKKWKKSKASSDDVGAADSFLDSSIKYQLAPFTYNRFQNTIAFTLHVKNVEPDSIAVLSDLSSVAVKFTSIGSGYFPINYAFYFDTDSASIETVPQPEAWDNNLIIQIELGPVDSFCTYRAGLSENDCSEFTCPQTRERKMSSRSDDDGVDLDATESIAIETVLSTERVEIEITNKNFDATPKKPAAPKQKKSKKANKKNRSFSESHCDELKAEQDQQQQQQQQKCPNANNPSSICMQRCITPLTKSRTQSESSNDDHHLTDIFPLKSILKRHSSYDRQTSECSIDEQQGLSCSIDLGIGSFTSIPEERDHELSESVRKTVRFDKQLCRKLLFKMNSTIIGQRKPKENKRKRKNRNHHQPRERCYSEGEASDYEHQQQNGQTAGCNGRCQDQSANQMNNNVNNNNNNNDGSSHSHAKSKNKSADKSAENKNGLMFDIEI